MSENNNKLCTCILVTGAGHSGTRLIAEMLKEHTDVCVPTNILDKTFEYPPLHQFFSESIAKTPLDSSRYLIDKNELYFLLDAYMQNIDINKNYFVLKMPYYPLICLDLILSYYSSNVKLIFTERPIEKLIISYQRNEEDKLFFKYKPLETLAQVKKLDLKNRSLILSSLDSYDFFKLLVDRCNELKNLWNINHPENPFLTTKLELLTSGEKEIVNWLNDIGLQIKNVKKILSIVDRKRLLSKSKLKIKGKIVAYIRRVLMYLKS